MRKDAPIDELLDALSDSTGKQKENLK